ncbi:MAG: flagellar basal body-associated FliL family protein [Pseudomonadota bacterium]
MAKDADKAADDKPKGGMMKMVMVAVGMLVIGAGGAYGAFAAGLLGGGDDAGPDVPKLVRKGDSDPYAIPGKKKDDGALVYGEGGSEYRIAYYSFSDSFTSNLADSPALIQVELAVSTQHDGRVLGWVKNHELALRSAILIELAATPEGDVFDPEGRQRLKDRLTKAINKVLEETEGFGGVDAVHFKGFLVQ